MQQVDKKLQSITKKWQETLVCPITYEELHKSIHVYITPQGTLYSEEGLKSLLSTRETSYKCPETNKYIKYASDKHFFDPITNVLTNLDDCILSAELTLIFSYPLTFLDLNNDGTFTAPSKLFIDLKTKQIITKETEAVQNLQKIYGIPFEVLSEFACILNSLNPESRDAMKKQYALSKKILRILAIPSTENTSNPQEYLSVEELQLLQTLPKTNNSITTKYIIRVAENGHVAMVGWILSQPDIDDLFDTQAVIHAARNGHVAVVQLLVEKGADVNHPDEQGRTALYYAAENGHVEVVRFFLSHPNIKINNHWKRIYMIRAARNGHVAVVQLLVENGADINQPDAQGRTALYYAAENGHVEMVRWLVSQRGIDNLSKDDAMIRAAHNGHVAVVQLLVENGADINQPDAQGRTALYYAESNGHTEVVRYLKNYIASRANNTLIVKISSALITGILAITMANWHLNNDDNLSR